MATSARRAISLNSFRRRAEVPATCSMLAPPVLFFCAPAHVALKSRLSLVSSSPHRKRMLQGADGRFPASSPAQSSSEPTLFLPFRALPRQTPTRRQRHLLASPALRLARVLGGNKSAIGRSPYGQNSTTY